MPTAQVLHVTAQHAAQICLCAARSFLACSGVVLKAVFSCYASTSARKGFYTNRSDFMWRTHGGGAASCCVSLLPPVLVRLVQPASSAGVSSGRLRESGLSASMRGCCRLWRLGFEYIPLWSTAAPPPPAIIIFSRGAVDKFALFPLSHTAPSPPHSLITRTAI